VSFRLAAQVGARILIVVAGLVFESRVRSAGEEFMRGCREFACLAGVMFDAARVGCLVAVLQVFWLIPGLPPKRFFRSRIVNISGLVLALLGLALVFWVLRHQLDRSPSGY
jgi:hypothetical protein